MNIKFLLIACLFSFSSFGQSSENMSLVGTLPYNVEASDVWGYLGSNNIEYALVGLNNGFSMVSLEDPANPIEMFFIAGQSTIWRDIKVWGDYAFVTSDETNEGLLIVDLSDLTGNTYTYTTLDKNDNFLCTHAHNIYIDESGKAYLFGGDISSDSNNSGALILDVTDVSLTGSIVLPEILGLFENFYLHDGMARGDTLWGAAIYEGKYFAIDVSDPTNPVIFNDSLAFYSTPNDFTHNCWISDDGNTLFTTDEVRGAYVGSYDVSGLDNIEELDKIRSSESFGSVIPHNVHVSGDFLVTSYYRDGIVVFDAKYPNNLIEVGHYDSYSNGGDGFDGSWGAYPFLPSGLILSSEINSSSTGNGLLVVLRPEYDNACYLQGNITNACNGEPINATIRILTSTVITSSSNLNGDYVSGINNSGTYSIEFRKEGFISDTLQVEMSNGELVVQDVSLFPTTLVSKSGTVTDINGNLLPLTNVKIYRDTIERNTVSNLSGEFTVDNVTIGNFTAIAGKWGYISNCITFNIDCSTLSEDTLILQLPLEEGYYDDFAFQNDWTVSGDASSGIWELGKPLSSIQNGVIYAPSSDVASDCFNQAYVTGNALGGGIVADDVDDGVTILQSPLFDLTTYIKPVISLQQWFVNSSNWSDANDTITISLHNASETKVLGYTYSQFNNNWIEKKFENISGIDFTDEMYITVRVSDYQPTNNIVEAGIDLFMIYDGSSVNNINENTGNSLVIYPNPTSSLINVPEQGQKFIYDVLGNLVSSTADDKIDVSRLPNGLYLIRVNAKSNRFIKK